jgi:AAA+ ATPase superfamily predicted ATPase
MQRIWDTNKDVSRINLVACGSIYSMMTRIFENAKEPLFGRATQRMHIKAFNINTLKEILSDYAPGYTAEDLLTFYSITGGVAKYVELLVQNCAFTKDTILDALLAENSLFLDEGKHVLIEEFGKEYGNYFSILSLIAAGKTARVEIESILEMETGGYLARLEKEYQIIQQIRPILAKPGSRSVKYKISDPFLSFWFRFIYRNRSAVEAGNLSYIKEIIDRDFPTYSGKMLEGYFIQQVKAEKKYNLIGTYWESKNQNEIDIVAVNDSNKSVLFAEVKRQKKKINLNDLEAKSHNLQQQFKGYSFTFKALALEDM